MNSRYRVRISGRNPEYFLRKLLSNQISFKLLRMGRREFEILVCETDYQELKKIRTSYKVELVGYTGFLALYYLLLKKYYLVIGAFLFCLILYILSSFCFQVTILENDAEFREVLKNELERYGIAPLHLQVSYAKKEEIEQKILETYPKELEWIEISLQGTHYVVHVERRKINDETSEVAPRNLVAKKDALITKIEAENGEVMKKINDYVKQGEVILSGAIMRDEEVKNLLAAKGRVLGEVWYEAHIEVPFHYYEEKETGKSQMVLTLQFLNHTIHLGLSSYDTARREDIFKIENAMFPARVAITKEEEIEVTDKTYSYEEALEQAHRLAEEKILTNSAVCRIISQKDLKITTEDSKIIVDVFLKAEEDITEYVEIKEEDLQKQEQGE